VQVWKPAFRFLRACFESVGLGGLWMTCTWFGTGVSTLGWVGWYSLFGWYLACLGSIYSSWEFWDFDCSICQTSCFSTLPFTHSHL